MGKKSLRFNFPDEWNVTRHYNRAFFGLTHLCEYIAKYFNKNGIDKTSMIEIGSYKGESAFIFAASKVFDQIYCIDPHSGDEEAIQYFDDTWMEVRRDFYNNTRFFDNIHLTNSYSNKVSKLFKNESVDFVYIDGNHTKEALTEDINLYLPKCKHFIGGHDYDRNSEQGNSFSVVDTVNELLGEPDAVFTDGSWIKKIGTQI